MSTFHLPLSTQINQVVPKKAFDKYTDTKEKKEFVEKVEKIRWLYKLATDTTNLPSKEVNEIQVFEITLRVKDSIPGLLKVIDRAIPYPILFILSYHEEYKAALSQKHLHPTNENNAVIDWTFTSSWYRKEESPFQLNLKQSIDYVFSDLCKQLSGRAGEDTSMSVTELVAKEQEMKDLESSIQKLESKIARTKQFNKKVELNVELQKLTGKLSIINK